LSIEQTFRQPSDALMHALDRLREIEEEKRTVPPADPRFAELAALVQGFARQVMAQSDRQGRLAVAAQQLVAEGDAAGLETPIVEVPPREMHVILDEWRDAERRVSLAVTGSPEAEVALADAARLREEYGRAYRAFERPNRPNRQPT
jgi:hypothetical protein